ncbi:MAG: hypothetical protein HeimC3_28170 [Candidatus Heimdallarchaeota archaeon LC_3]|nr:MAG: hypothetical protein HeimC3_28170 [Candidatus Heimdallarchaeota archaeon LC_3]
MKIVTVKDILFHEEYEKIRENYMSEFLPKKKFRRIDVGGKFTFVFENFETTKFQIQELVRVERPKTIEEIQEMCDIYNLYVPKGLELSTTFFINLEEKSLKKVEHMKKEFEKLKGIGNSARIWIGSEKIEGYSEEGRENEEQISAVQYVRFSFTTELADKFMDESVDVLIGFEHPNWYDRNAIRGEMRKSLINDLKKADQN